MENKPCAHLLMVVLGSAESLVHGMSFQHGLVIIPRWNRWVAPLPCETTGVPCEVAGSFVSETLFARCTRSGLNTVVAVSHQENNQFAFGSHRAL